MAAWSRTCPVAQVTGLHSDADHEKYLGKAKTYPVNVARVKRKRQQVCQVRSLAVDICLGSCCSIHTSSAHCCGVVTVTSMNACSANMETASSKNATTAHASGVLPLLL